MSKSYIPKPHLLLSHFWVIIFHLSLSLLILSILLLLRNLQQQPQWRIEPDGRRLVLLHDDFEGSEKVFLKPEIGEFSLLDKFHRKLPEGIHGEESHVFVGVASHLKIRVNMCKLV